MSSTVTFWIIPWNIVGPILAAFAFVLLVTFLLVRLYVRRSIAHLSSGRRVVRRRKKGKSPFMLFIVVLLAVTALFLLALLLLLA